MTNQILTEYTKCLLQPDYYAEKYSEVFDLTRGGTFPLKIFPKQSELLKHYRENRFSLVLKPRQAGVSTVTAFHCAHLMMFAPEKKKQKILIIANMQDTAHEFLAKIVSFIDTAPNWLMEYDGEGKVKYVKKNAGEIVLPNGSGAKAKATSKDALRGYAPTLLILDEAAFIERGDELWTASLPVLSTGGRAILLSTPNGYDALYHTLYEGAVKNENPFKIFEMNWYQDPRFNKDLEWIKTVVDEEGNTKQERIATKDLTIFKELIIQGYKPTSTWFRTMCEGFNNDARKIAQELECLFKSTLLTVKNKKTGIIEEISIESLYKRLK